MKDKKRIFLFIGPKGSGKSYLGDLMQRHSGIPFLRVEDWAKKVKKDRAFSDETYLKDVFETIEQGVRACLENNGACSFESTGLTAHFDKMMSSLSKDYHVRTIGVQCPPEVCLQRVKHRDQTMHINVSDEHVEQINRLVREKDMKTDFSIANNNKKENELLQELRVIAAT